MITQSFYTLTNTGFIILIDFVWTTPKNTKSPITTPKKYDHPHHPNIGSTPWGVYIVGRKSATSQRGAWVTSHFKMAAPGYSKVKASLQKTY